MTGDNLGRALPWQIKEFPEGLRRQITDQARVEGLSVGDFLTRCMLLLRDAGWPRAFDAGGFANHVKLSNPPLDATRLRNALEMTCMVAEHAERMPKGVAGQAFGLLRTELRAIRRTGQTNADKPALPAPEAPHDPA